MRVALLHNRSAGGDRHSNAELVSLLRRAGHEVKYVAKRVSELTAALHETPCDVVIVAGGDGTVGKAACELSGWQVPLGILPFGTANNTARALNLSGSPKKLAESWHAAVPVPFSMGVLSDGPVRCR